MKTEVGQPKVFASGLVLLGLMGTIATIFVRGSILLADDTMSEPLFDFSRILNDPLAAKVLEEKKTDGIVIQRIEYAGPRKDGETVRVFGILAYPSGSANLPAVFWSQNGMAAASEHFPLHFARRGYFCLNVTLDHSVWNSFEPFETNRPKTANLTQLAVVQMRGITYLTKRPEVDADRIGIAGGSYGGFFATLIAGADSRVKAGISFFGAGSHHLGTNLPQFTGMKTRRDIQIWKTTIDPTWRLRRRAVPFLWGVGSNDHWFHLPAIFDTYLKSSGEKRLAVAVPWGHAGPSGLDEQLLTWLDVYLKGTQSELNKAGDLRIRSLNGRLFGHFDWTGERRATKAELVVSYGPAKPWHEWIHRCHFVFPATMTKQQAVGEIPLLDPTLDVFVFAILTDENGAIVATLPKTVRPTSMGIKEGSTRPGMLNGFPQGDFETDDVKFFLRSGLPFGSIDETEQHTGRQSVRLKAGQKIVCKLYHVPTRPHRLRLFLKTMKPAKVSVQVRHRRPQNHESAVAQILRGKQGQANEIPLPMHAIQANTTNRWQPFEIDCRNAAQPIAGYELVVEAPDNQGCWLDAVRFEPR